MTTRFFKVYHKGELLACHVIEEGMNHTLIFPLIDGRQLLVTPRLLGFYQPVVVADKISISYEEEK